MTATELLAMAAGLAMGLSLIVAIGAQNSFVLRQGLRGEHVGAVVGVCIASDAALILSSVAGAGSVVKSAPGVVAAIRVLGAAFLVTYGILSARRAIDPGPLRAETTGGQTALGSVVGRCLALTWLNPHAYLDTILIGSLASTHGAGRWWFGVGALVGSVIWYPALGFGARLLRPLFALPNAWRALDATIAGVMVAIAVSLLLGGG